MKQQTRRFVQMSLLLALLAAVLTGCGSSGGGTKVQTTAPDGDVVTTYDDPKNGLRMTFPGDWHEPPTPMLGWPKGTIIVLVAPSSASGLQMPPTLHILAKEIAPENGYASPDDRLDQMQKHMIDRASGEFKDFALIESDSTTIGATPARRIVFRGKKSALGVTVSVQVMNIVAVVNNKQFGFSYSADPEFFVAQRPAVESVISSVKFVP